MRILVTGSRGYIGAVLVPMLGAEGHDVVGLDSDLFEQCTFGEWTDAYPFLRKDVRDIEASDLKDFDGIVHLAGLSDDSLGALVPQLTYDINHAASIRVRLLVQYLREFRREPCQ
jgi:nucleoside-diphosphate-sugar epimerase